MEETGGDGPEREENVVVKTLIECHSRLEIGV